MSTNNFSPSTNNEPRMKEEATLVPSQRTKKCLYFYNTISKVQNCWCVTEDWAQFELILVCAVFIKLEWLRTLKQCLSWWCIRSVFLNILHAFYSVFIYHLFRCPLFSAHTIFSHSLELMQFISFPVWFPVLDLFYVPFFLISFYSHHILLPLRTSFILAFSECDTISLYIFKSMLHFPLISHTNCCSRNKGEHIW